MLSWPSHNAMTEGSTPDCSRCMAVVCRSVCGLTFRVAKEGQVAAASRTALSRRYSMPDLVIRPPSQLGNNGESGAPYICSSHCRSCFAVPCQSGTTRSFLPFP